MPPCLPNCFCDACLPQRVREVEALSLDQQRAFWERVASAAPARPHPAAAVNIIPSTHHQQRIPAQRRRSASPPSPPPAYPPPPRSHPPPPVDLHTLVPPPPPGVRALQVTAATIRRDDPFQLSMNLLQVVSNLRDALEIIQERIDTAGPRRRQCMFEAMQRVVSFYETFAESVIPPRPPPVPTNIDHLSTQIYDSSISCDSDRKECTFCQEEFQDGEELIVLPCTHLFHNSDDCFKGWIREGKTACANCRKDFGLNS